MNERGDNLRSRVLRYCSTFLMEAAVLVLVFGLYENYTRGILTLRLAVGSGCFCLLLFFAGLILEVRR
jgi:hypothetical protein